MNNLKIIMSLIILLNVPYVYADVQSTLIKSCTMYQQKTDVNQTSRCELYIRGYVDAIVHQQTMGLPTSRDKSHSSEFIKRAYQTRVANNGFTSDTQGYHNICIKHLQDQQSITTLVAKNLNINELNNKPIGEVVYDTLATQFPCKTVPAK